MEIDSQITEVSLAALGDEASSLVCSGDLATLVRRFGYARALGRDIGAAVAEDFKRCLNELKARSLAPRSKQPAASVKYFGRNDTGLVALVECSVLADNGRKVLLELVVTEKGAAKYLSLEDISVAV